MRTDIAKAETCANCGRVIPPDDDERSFSREHWLGLGNGWAKWCLFCDREYRERQAVESIGKSFREAELRLARENVQGQTCYFVVVDKLPPVPYRVEGHEKELSRFYADTFTAAAVCSCGWESLQIGMSRRTGLERFARITYVIWAAHAGVTLA